MKKNFTQILNDLSYDLILGRDWCEANGVIIDFTKRKVYFIKPLEKTKSFGLILGDSLVWIYVLFDASFENDQIDHKSMGDMQCFLVTAHVLGLQRNTRGSKHYHPQNQKSYK